MIHYHFVFGQLKLLSSTTYTNWADVNPPMFTPKHRREQHVFFRTGIVVQNNVWSKLNQHISSNIGIVVLVIKWPPPKQQVAFGYGRRATILTYNNERTDNNTTSQLLHDLLIKQEQLLKAVTEDLDRHRQLNTMLRDKVNSLKWDTYPSILEDTSPKPSSANLSYTDND